MTLFQTSLLLAIGGKEAFVPVKQVASSLFGTNDSLVLCKMFISIVGLKETHFSWRSPRVGDVLCYRLFLFLFLSLSLFLQHNLLLLLAHVLGSQQFAACLCSIGPLTFQTSRSRIQLSRACQVELKGGEFGLQARLPLSIAGDFDLSKQMQQVLNWTSWLRLACYGSHLNVFR